MHCRICTIDAHGTLIASGLISYIVKGRCLLEARFLESGHGHISENPKVAFEIDVYEHGDDGLLDFRGLMLKGEAHQVTNPKREGKL